MAKSVKWIVIVIGVFLFIGILRLLIFTSSYIPNQGMENNLMQGDHIIINKLSYGFKLPFTNTKLNISSPQKGDIVLFENPIQSLEESPTQGVYISRCIGAPGDTLIIDSLFNIMDTAGFFNPDQTNQYQYDAQYQEEISSILKKLQIEKSPAPLDSLKMAISLSAFELYLVEQELLNEEMITLINRVGSSKLHPLIIPKKGKSIKIEPWNMVLLYNTIILHEKRDIKMEDDALWWNGKKILRYTFTKNYSWMKASHSGNQVDSRQFGFVPEDLLIGKASFIWFSKDPLQNLFHGYRWTRMFQPIY